MKTASRQHIEDCENKVELKMVRFARHGTNEVCGVECKSAVFYGTELSNPQSSSIGELYRGNILEGISLPQAASRFSSRNLQIEKNQCLQQLERVNDQLLENRECFEEDKEK